MSEIIQNQADDNGISGLEGHSEKEKQEILHEIDQITEQNRLTVTDDLFKITPLKKGGTLPLVINILGILAIVASFYFTNRYFQEQEQTMAMEESSYESTEGSVIEELKRQAEEKLNKKQEEISQIQNELSKLDRESASLRENMDSQIKDKELELRSEMEAALADEKARLQNQDISTAELEKQLQEFQKTRENTFASEIAEFKSESEAAIKEKEEELAKSKQIAKDILEQANRDKAVIEADTQKREAQLTRQFEAEKEALTRESSEATQKLKELSELQKNEQLIQDQLTGSYNSIIESIKTGNYTEAQIGIDDVRNLLNDPNVLRLPTISKKKNVELFFLDTMEKEIQQAGVRTTTDFTSLTRAAEVLLSARQNVEFGTNAEAEGNEYDAKRFYNEALSTLPQISKAIENLNAIETRDRTARSREYILLANKAADSKQMNEAIKQYRAADVSTAHSNMDANLTTAINGIERVLNQEKEDLATLTRENLKDLEADMGKTITDLNSEIDIREETITDLNSELGIREENINTITSSLEELENSNADLASEKNNLEQIVSEIDTREIELKDDVELLATKVEDSKKTIDDLNQKVEESAKTIDSLTTEVKKSAFAIDALTKKAARAVNRAEVLEQELNDAVNQIVELIN
ncbi:MAG: hypothetical protein KAH95_05385 [Spirochaetales bacterium]|nr:hypothetical protein [Spirochaetales bacterium]